MLQFSPDCAMESGTAYADESRASKEDRDYHPDGGF